jgi:hypothetical protein
LEQPCLLHK